MVNITTFLEDILEAQQKGQNTWSRWIERLGSYCERHFGPNWQQGDRIFWDKFPFHWWHRSVRRHTGRGSLVFLVSMRPSAQIRERWTMRILHDSLPENNFPPTSPNMFLNNVWENLYLESPPFLRWASRFYINGCQRNSKPINSAMPPYYPTPDSRHSCMLHNQNLRTLNTANQHLYDRYNQYNRLGIFVLYSANKIYWKAQQELIILVDRVNAHLLLMPVK